MSLKYAYLDRESAALRSILPHLALLFAFGFMTPKMKGLDFLDSQILGAYACLAMHVRAAGNRPGIPCRELKHHFKQAKFVFSLAWSTEKSFQSRYFPLASRPFI